MRILLLQCELEHPHQPPHLAMALYAPDLEADGHAVEALLVHPTAMGALEERLRRDPPDLVALDAVFPLDLVARIRGAAPGALLVVGGHAAAQHALRGRVDVAIVGDGRAALRRLAADPSRAGEVPGALFRDASGRLDAGPPPDPARDPMADLFPFRPRLRWGHLGPARGPDDHLNAPSIVAESGCPWEAPLAREPSWRDVPPRLPDADLSPAAARLIAEALVGNARGCTFCSFRYQPYRRRAVAAALPALVEQARWMVRQEGARSLSLQTESPFPYVVPLLDALEADGIRLAELRIRGFPRGILGAEGELREAVPRARRSGTRLTLHQVGFESFAEADLALFHKGIGAADNRRCARLLASLEAEHGPDVFTGTRGHGLVPFHPWATLDTLRDNFEAVMSDAPFLRSRLSPFQRLELYGEWIPVFWRARDEGLAVPVDGAFGWDWRFRDPAVADLDRALRGAWARLDALTAPPPGAASSLRAAWEARRRTVLAAERPRLFRDSLAAAREGGDDPRERARGLRAVAEAMEGRLG
ncbi:hypothetical protein L6R50_02760 [Myxococcota bacterium]|nr:hypothetical protein [Myxococcota bacterium]